MYTLSVICIFCVFSFSVIGADAGNGIRVFIPDIGMFVVGLGIWLLCRSSFQKRPPEEMGQYNADFEAEEQVGFICNFTFVYLSVFLLDLPLTFGKTRFRKMNEWFFFQWYDNNSHIRVVMYLLAVLFGPNMLVMWVLPLFQNPMLFACFVQIHYYKLKKQKGAKVWIELGVDDLDWSPFPLASPLLPLWLSVN